MTKIDLVNFMIPSRKTELNSKNELTAKGIKPLHYLCLYHLNKGNSIDCPKVFYSLSFTFDIPIVPQLRCFQVTHFRSHISGIRKGQADFKVTVFIIAERIVQASIPEL